MNGEGNRTDVQRVYNSVLLSVLTIFFAFGAYSANRWVDEKDVKMERLEHALQQVNTKLEILQNKFDLFLEMQKRK